MDMDQHPDLDKKDPRSECRGFESSYQACTQPRKISRGILIDSSAKFGSKNANEEVLMQSDEYLTPSIAAAVEYGKRGVAINSTDMGKHTSPVVEEVFPSLSTRTFHQKIPIVEAAHRPTESNCNETSQKQFDSMITTTKKDSNAVGMEKLSFVNAEEVIIADVTKKAETKGHETLRMKLWEILGTVSSPKQHLNDYDLKAGTKDLELPQENNEEHNLAVKSKQNSDTIESDSEFPSDMVIRPMARSLSKKQAPNRLKANRTRNAPSAYYKDNGAMDTAYFREGFSARISHGTHGGSLKKNKSKQQGSSSEACKTFTSNHENQGDDQWVRNEREIAPICKRSLWHENEGGNDKEFQSRRETESMEPKSVALHREPHLSPLMKLSDNLRSVMHGPKLQDNANCKEDAGCSFFKGTMNEKVDAKSPSFEMRTPAERSSPGFLPTEIKTPTESFSDGSPPKRQHRESDDCSLGEMIIFNTKGIQCFKSWLDSKSNCYVSNSQINSSDDAGEHDDAPPVNPRPTVEEEPEIRLSKSTSENSDSEASEEDSHVKDFQHLPLAWSQACCKEPELHFPKVGNAEKLTNVLHLNKKQRFLDGTKISGFSPTFTSRKGVEEHCMLQQHLEVKQEDGLPREVALFALTLKKFKSKINSVTRKRSAEILMSVAEKIYSQVQDAKYQIQTDAGKLTNHTKSKRKRLEMRYQELQGDLVAMHERFKEEVNQHLQLYKSTVEGLEAQQMELKVAVEKQRASNRKLLLQAEAVIETELGDAQRRITMIQNSARQKMLQLKNIIADCLKESNFS